MVEIVTRYLDGSISFEIIIGRLVGGNDIREAGNPNPGTANTERTLGNRWGLLVFMGDLSKVMFSMSLGRYLFLDLDQLSQLVIVMTGVAAIVGHRKPLFFGFSG